MQLKFYTSTINGVLHMICENSIEDGKYWKGKLCDNLVKVSSNTKSALCSSCTSLVVDPPKTYEVSSGRPRGWQFMNLYVHQDGTVFRKGIEQPELFNTLPVTIVEEKVKAGKLTKTQKTDLRSKLSLEIRQLQKSIDEESRRIAKIKLEKQQNKLRRQFNKLI